MKDRKKVTLFDIRFTLYFLSLFLDDLALDNTGIILKMFRYLSYLILIIYVVKLNKTQRNDLMRCILFMTFGLFVALFTHDIYWCVVSLLVLSARNINSRRVVELSFCILLICTAITVLLALVGILPIEANEIVRRGEIVIRYGMGFYHSNVLPMAIFSLLIYRLILVGEKIKVIELLGWNALSLVVYQVCKSRNGLYATIICCGLYIIYYSFGKKMRKFLLTMSKSSLCIVIIFSFLMVAVQGLSLRPVWLINDFFTGRFAIAYHQVLENGIYFISLVSKNEYALTARVLDNGYLYTALRYGVLFLVFYLVVQHNILKKYSSNGIIAIVMIALVFTNMVDNDLYSYGFLPIILLAFSKRPIIYRNSNSKKQLA